MALNGKPPGLQPRRARGRRERRPKEGVVEASTDSAGDAPEPEGEGPDAWHSGAKGSKDEWLA